MASLRRVSRWFDLSKVSMLLKEREGNKLLIKSVIWECGGFSEELTVGVVI